MQREGSIAMAEITASLVKDLREKTGAGMMDCKKALTETAGDLEAAVDWLRKKGLAAAAKKAGRVAAEGLVAVAASGARGAVLEVNAETDFVARNDQFQAFAKAAAEVALQCGGDLEKTKAAAFPGGGTVAEKLTNLVATIGENMSMRRAVALSVPAGVVTSYVHNAAAPGLGKIGVLVAVESTADAAALSALGKQIAMHVAAANPTALDITSVDPAALQRERAILTEQAAASGKPVQVVEKMVEGRLRKFYEETVLLEQLYVVDGESREGRRGEGREGARRPGEAGRLRALRPGRGRREEAGRLRGRGRRAAQARLTGGERGTWALPGTHPRAGRTIGASCSRSPARPSWARASTASTRRPSCAWPARSSPCSPWAWRSPSSSVEETSSAACPAPRRAWSAPRPTTWACSPRS
jgi:elongation factor Ts